MTHYLYSNKGGRGHNEDAADAKIYPNGAVYVLADGLGGHRKGEVASQTAADTIMQSVFPDMDGETLAALLTQVNDKLLDLQRQPELSGIKTTALTLLVREHDALWGYAGDSRLYYLSGNRIVLSTRDHSVSYKKYLSGEISRAALNFDEDRSSLLSVFGSAERFAPEFGQTAVQPGDAFLLCSDGFWEYLYDEEILIDFLKADSPKAWAELMLLRHIARARPGNDNFTLIAVFID